MYVRACERICVRVCGRMNVCVRECAGVRVDMSVYEEERREACQGQAKEKDGPEDGGESRNSKCGHYDWQRQGVG